MKNIMETSKTRVRFHLGAGENYMKWQIKTANKVSYVAPEHHQIVMFNAKLINQANTAKKIYEGANKTVCAWIECDEVKVVSNVSAIGNDWSPLFFNPRKNINWVDSDGNNVNKSEYSLVYTVDRNIFAKKQTNDLDIV